MKAGWETKTLDQISANLDSRRVPITKGVRVSGAYPYYGASGVVDYVAGYIFDEDTLLVSEDGANLLARSTPIAFPASGKYWVNNHAHILKFENLMTQRFVELYLESIPLDEYITGAAQPKLNQKALNSIPIPVPPLPEQHRIVTILDKAFDGIATAKANAEKNLQNARALFESHLQSVFTERGEGWLEKQLDDVCEKITDGTHHSPKIQFPNRQAGLFPYITSKNIRNNFMDLSKVAYIEREFHEEVYARCQPRLGDVLLTKDGASTGNVTLNVLDEPFSLLSSVCLIKTRKEALQPAFLCYYIQSSVGLKSIVGQMTGAAIKRIVLKDIKRALVPFPLLQEQERIVETLDALLVETQRLESLYQQKLTALDNLKKSLLHQAFSGQL